MCIRIISSGQDGAEQAAIDAAVDLGVKHTAPAVSDAHEDDRVERQILDSNGTVVFYYGETNERIATAIKTAVLQGYPCMVVDFSTQSIDRAVIDLRCWIDQNRITRLFVTGLRNGEDERIYNDTRMVISRTIERIQCDAAPK